MPKLSLSTKIFLGIILGFFVGFIFGDSILFLDPIGQLFIKLLKMIIVPLIIASVIMGVAEIGDVRKLGRLGGKTVLYYLSTTGLAVVIGIIMVNVMQPGVGVNLTLEKSPEAAPPSLIDTLMGIVPANPFEAVVNMDMLPIIFFSILIGVVLTTIGKKAKPLVSFFDSLNAVMMKLTHWIMELAPYGVFALMAVIVAETGGDVIIDLAKYMATVLIGLLIHGFVILPLILKIIGKGNPFQFAKDMSSALATAFSTSSSSATLPVTMESIEKNAGVDNTVSSFVLTLGATINMDGTALYEAVAAIFIAQVYGIDLTFAQQLLIIVTATLAAIGAAGIPSAGLITMIIVLNQVNLPLEGIGLITAVDRILDMVRTTVNVWGDSVGARTIAATENAVNRVESAGAGKS
ncbi:MAG: dicarboxylate/amino acid:cation symporter [Candidatus Marinimicrobia bacterium]|nr:dicarboxylate/amino acid:cation symporter [Candidatus Neomarinimicrobiota bacterium]MCF7830002.1 dicarboxylate/amino acid:cation symporter [Candidatus Neomarinimicrobiota bacterium]MCF7881956.1 dicarboxylate/amino acid:cation symporter [Candidatus Neomarinimicrobiota bacterium]